MEKFEGKMPLRDYIPQKMPADIKMRVLEVSKTYELK